MSKALDDKIDNAVLVHKEDLALLMSCAHRYALPRHTYVAGMITNIIIEHKNELLDFEKERIINETEEYLLTGDCWDMDKVEWEKMIEELKSE